MKDPKEASLDWIEGRADAADAGSQIVRGERRSGGAIGEGGLGQCHGPAGIHVLLFSQHWSSAG